MGCGYSGYRHEQHVPPDWDGYNITTPYEAQHPPTAIYQEMNLPLSCYFISSGHNSYLTGNQLNSDSGVTTIQKALKLGCRVIELDVYNPSVGFDGPICKHGGTLTAPITLFSCVLAIKDYAFLSSPFPVIITIENHTDTENQHAMAEIFKQVLGEMLYIPKPAEVGLAWHSPDDLKYKVLIRMNVGVDADELMRSLVYIPNVKFTSLENANTAGVSSSSSFAEPYAAEILKKAFTATNLSLKPPERAQVVHGEGAPLRPMYSPSQTLKRAFAGRKSQQLGQDDDQRKDQDKDFWAGWGEEDREQPPEPKLPREKGQKVDAAQLGSARDAPHTLYDQEVVKAIRSLGEVYAYNCRNIMRVYPSGLRINSSNYNPMRAWCLGASVVALNWQTWDRPLWINQALFSQNGGCGYILKPPWMLHHATRQPCTALKPLSDVPADPLPMRTPRILSVQLLTAYCKQKKRMRCLMRDIDVQVTVFGMPMDWQSQRSRVFRFHPPACLHIDRTFEFPIHYSEMAVLMVSLLDVQRNDRVLAHWEVPVATLSTGTFKIDLTDRHGMQRADRWIKLGLTWANEALRPGAETVDREGLDGLSVLPTISQVLPILPSALGRDLDMSTISRDYTTSVIGRQVTGSSVP